MRVVTLIELRYRYAAFREAMLILRSSYQSVASRKAAIDIRDEFERDVRDGMLDGLFDESENWV